MLALSLNKITKSYGVDVILQDVSFTINENEKVGFVGKNGAGKTTLFKILTGEITPDSGEKFIPKDKKLGYLSQNLGLDEELTVFEETMKVFEDIKSIEYRLRELEVLIAENANDSDNSNYEKYLKEYGRLQDDFEKKNGYGCESFAKGILVGLGIGPEYLDKSISLLSGGQKTRVALSKLLLQNPDVLLLDEPTNHLDLEAINFLEGFLRDYRGTVIIISHDRYFLDVITTKTFELTNGVVEEYGGNYSYFIEERRTRYKQRLKEYELQQKEIERIESMIEKFRSFNREKSIKQAESREKMLEKIERIDKPLLDEKSSRINFECKVKSGVDVMIVDELSKSYSDRKLFENISFMIRREERIALIGENGRGKSTIFKIIKEDIAPSSGYIKIGKNVQIGYYDQEQRELSTHKTILDEIWDSFPHMAVKDVRNTLAAFLFTGDDVFKEISLLSGGEKCRLALLKLMLSKPNFLLLDEPTNHLDILSREALEEALLSYDGTLFVISHDRYFLNKIINRILELDENSITEYLGNFQYYIEKKNANDDDLVVSTVGKTKTQVKEERKKLRGEREKIKKAKLEIKDIEKTLEKLESEIASLEEDLCNEEVYSNPEKSLEVNTKINNNKKKIDELYERWEILMEEVEE
ncbi:ribosomal protection-like ABC-F family protein [Clostridium cylindrosporum]|uniref:ABC transporter ATP-binding protein n=1 Tax=Clostridium cylindrosporum DSM 605 TaxID=1121307 RepID=A0A0J8DGK3_CLOCY|nr:ABC-F family ATP-binding cassette domain-containing protein [Clostridium cylindrosporum]KMT23308.1 ABC transporter ATP-binding protein [Clostridium cylindrosporum DSM 605]